MSLLSTAHTHMRQPRENSRLLLESAVLEGEAPPTQVGLGGIQ